MPPDSVFGFYEVAVPYIDPTTGNMNDNMGSGEWRDEPVCASGDDLSSESPNSGFLGFGGDFV